MLWNSLELFRYELIVGTWHYISFLYTKYYFRTKYFLVECFYRAVLVIFIQFHGIHRICGCDHNECTRFRMEGVMVDPHTAIGIIIPL